MSKEIEALREKIANILGGDYTDPDVKSAVIQILQAFKESGGVFLAENQSLPLVQIDFEAGIGANIEATKEVMLRANFRKIRK